MQIKTFKANKYNNRIFSVNPIITERFLTMLLKTVSNQKGFKRTTLLNFQKFLSQIQFESYEKDPNVYVLLMTCDIIIKNRLEGISEKEELIEMINLEILDNFDDIKNDIIFPTILGGEEATDKEKVLVKKTIDLYLRYDAILSKKDLLTDIITDIGSGNVSNLENTLSELRDVIGELNDEFKKTDAVQEKYIFTHTTDSVDFLEKLKATYENETTAKLVLKTGLQMFNEMLSIPGGFLGSKAYIFYSDTNSFKSALLKYISKWIQKYNSKFFKEDFLRTGRRPTILYISLEDGEKEDINRLFTIYTRQDLSNMSNFEAVKNVWHKEYDKSIIDICQVNSTENSINIKTIDGFVKSLYDQNYEVIALIVDSFDLMAPEEEDVRRNITDEYLILSHRAKAIQKYIGDKPFPFITAHQLNRAGNQMLTEMKSKGATDLAKSLGRSFISGAYDIERRMHWSAFIYTEWSKYDDELYLELNRMKCKYKRSPIDYLVHKLENQFIITDDIGMKEPLSRTSIVPDTMMNDMVGPSNGSVGSRGVTSIASSDYLDIAEESKAMFETDVILENDYQVKELEENYFIPVNKTGLVGYTPYDVTNNEEYVLQNEGGCTPFDLKGAI